MKLLHWLVAAPLMILAVLFAISNMGGVELGLWPLADRRSVPVFLIVFAAFAIGFFAGGFVAWVGGHKHRSRARAAEHKTVEQAREIVALQRKLDDVEAAARTPDPEPKALVAVNGR